MSGRQCIHTGPPAHLMQIPDFLCLSNLPFCCAWRKRHLQRKQLGAQPEQKPSQIVHSLTLSICLGRISCRPSSIARTWPLRRPKISFLQTGTLMSDILLCHGVLRTYSVLCWFSSIFCAALIPSHQGEALDFLTLLDIPFVAGDFVSRTRLA